MFHPLGCSLRESFDDTFTNGPMPAGSASDECDVPGRLFDVFRLLKITRYTKSTSLIVDVFRKKSQELAITALVMSIWLVFVSSIMYYVERGAQPEEFSSIPAAIYWGVITLITVGYGDVAPVTPLGRALGGATALLGIALFALPAGIFASGFAEVLAERRRGTQYCPHCGEEVTELSHEPLENDNRTQQERSLEGTAGE